MHIRYYEDDARLEMRVSIEEAAHIRIVLGTVLEHGNPYGRVASCLWKKLGEIKRVTDKFEENLVHIDSRTHFRFNPACESKAPAQLTPDANVVEDGDYVELDMAFAEALILRTISGVVVGQTDIRFTWDAIHNELTGVALLNKARRLFWEQEVAPGSMVRTLAVPVERE